MDKYAISIPYFKDLTKRENWHTDDKRTFFALRLNMYIEKSYTDHRLYNGDIIGGYSSPDGMGLIEEITLKYKSSITNINKTIENYISECEFMEAVANELSEKMNIPNALCTDAVLKTTFSSKIREVSSITRECEAVRFAEREETKTIKKEMIPTKYQKIYATKTYKKVKCDVYFAYADYLYVSYYKTPMGILKIRSKKPKVIGNEHVNKHIIKSPAFSMIGWEHFENSIWFVNENEYRDEVGDQTKFFIYPLDVSRMKNITIPKYSYESIPTLYQIANSAFLLNSKNKKKDWTKEELKELEEKENGSWAILNRVYTQR